VIQKAGENADDFEFEPLHAADDDDQTGGEDSTRSEAVHIGVADGYGEKGKEKGQASDDLGAVPQGVPYHGGSYREHEEQIDELRGEDLGGRDVVHRVGGEEQQRPPTANASARENLITMMALEPDSRA
jgi:hypothetical protein